MIYIYLVEKTIEEGKENRLEREKIYTHCAHHRRRHVLRREDSTHVFHLLLRPLFIIISPPFFVLNIERRLFFLDTTTVKSVFSKRSSSTREDFSLSCACIACACHKSSVSSLFLCFSALCARLMMMMQCGFFPALVIH